MSQPEIYPDSRLKNPKGVVRAVLDFMIGGKPTPITLNMEPIFCAQCGKDGGYVPTENMTFAFYVCEPCAEKMGPVDGIYFEPDALFWERVKAEQIERYGRELTQYEMAEALKDELNPLAKLAKDRKWRGE